MYISSIDKKEPTISLQEKIGGGELLTCYMLHAVKLLERKEAMNKNLRLVLFSFLSLRFLLILLLAQRSTRKFYLYCPVGTTRYNKHQQKLIWNQNQNIQTIVLTAFNFKWKDNQMKVHTSKIGSIHFFNSNYSEWISHHICNIMSFQY